MHQARGASAAFCSVDQDHNSGNEKEDASNTWGWLPLVDKTGSKGAEMPRRVQPFYASPLILKSAWVNINECEHNWLLET